MLNYIRADVRRILGRKSHAFSMFLLFFIFFATLYFPNRNEQMTSVSLITSACSTLDWLLIFVGLFELIAVFAEDFKVKTMQVAIGLGISRAQVVVCKLVESIILLILNCLVYLLLTLGIGAMLGVSVPANVLRDLVNVLLVKGVLANACFTSLTMIVLFVTQSSILAIFVYVLIGVGAVSILLTLTQFIGIDWVETLRLNHITLSYLLSAFHTRLALGTFDFLSFLGIALHLFAGVFITCKLFAKRELDF